MVSDSEVRSDQQTIVCIVLAQLSQAATAAEAAKLAAIRLFFAGNQSFINHLAFTER